MTKIYLGSYPSYSLCQAQGKDDVSRGMAASWTCELDPDGTRGLYESLG